MSNSAHKYSPKNPQKRIEKHPPLLMGRHPTKDEWLVTYGQTYMMLAAPPGSGKGVGIVIPNLLAYPDSVVVNDPKFENWNITAGFRALCGHKCYRFSPELLETHRWNPLSFLNRDPLYRLGEIRTMASVLYSPDNPKNAGWFKKAGNIFTALVLYLMETPELPFTLPQVYEIAAMGERLGDWVQEILDNRLNGDRALSSECVRELNRVLGETKNKQGWPTTEGILNERLSVYGEKTVAWALSGTDIDFSKLREELMSVYFCVTEGNIKKFGPLMNLFFSQAIRANTKVMPEEGGHCADGTLKFKYQVLFVLDEIAVMGHMEVMETAPALTRGAGLRYLIVFQSKDQMRSDKTYGVEGGNGIMKAFHVEVVFAPGDEQLAKEYSTRLGNTTVRVAGDSVSYGQNKTRSNSFSFQPRALMLPQEIDALPYSEELIFIQGTKKTPPRNIRARKIFWYEDRILKERAGLALPKIPKGDAQLIEALVVPMIKSKSNAEMAPPYDQDIRQEQQRRNMN
ncbi:type IV secretory system conjugative DNA transfer family protein [Yersinia ruckeri]|uniref:type IV secretory system conjugative DNA transfer family protein n=1 Tax=Yersinia ruckeri TaxID=29486 RepID=UPI0022376B38|nr:type IV secretory system conjugative DNA transfer family protein [Yersinia ruckeri]MCW6572915.1 type IV secretory system conjugative DNA transfer family protein [Yersinia ruckeri]